MIEDMRRASVLADSNDPGEAAKGFISIAKIVSKEDANLEVEFGFIDNALFMARKLASSGDISVRNAVSGMLIAIGRMDSEWLEAAIETADEIKMQPSYAAQSVAAGVISELRRK